MKKTPSTFGSFFGGVLSTVTGIIITGMVAGAIIYVARWIAGPAKYVVVDDKAKTAKT